MFRALCAHHQEVKIVLYSVWYHHTETSEWYKITKIQFYRYEHKVVKLCMNSLDVITVYFFTISVLRYVESVTKTKTKLDVMDMCVRLRCVYLRHVTHFSESC